MILDDSMLSVEPREIIRNRAVQRRMGAEVHQMDALLAQFDEIEDAYLRERKADVHPGRRARDEGAARAAGLRAAAAGTTEDS